MAGTILLIVLFVLCVLFLLPIRVKGSFGDGKWSVQVYYALLRVFKKESQPPPPPPETPPLPDVTADTQPPEHVPAAQPESAPQPASVQDAKPEKPKKPKKPKKPDQPEETPAPDALPAEDAAPESGKPKKKKRGIRGFIERLKPHSVSDVIGLAKDGFGSLNPALRFLLRHFHFRHVRLYLAVASDDAANTAQLYGKICAGAFPLLAAMQCALDIETDEFRILADFYNDKITFRASLELRVSPAALLLTVLMLGLRFLRRTIRRFRREDKEAKRMVREQQPAVQH